MTRSLAAVLIVALGACGSGPPGDGDGDADAGSAERVCGQVYCLELGQEIVFIGLSSIGAIDVRGQRVYAVSGRGDGIVREFRLTAAGLEPADSAVDLDNRIPNPSGFSHTLELAVLGDNSPSGVTITFFDFAQAVQTGELDGSIVATATDDLGNDPAGPEIVTLNGVEHLACADRSAGDSRVRIYDPTPVAISGLTSGGLVSSFAAPANARALFFWHPVLALITQVSGESPTLVLLDLDESIATESAVEFDAIELPGSGDVIGFHELSDGRLLVARADGSARVAELKTADE